MPPFFLTADFRGNFGFLRLNAEDVCSFSDGSFKSTTRKAKLVQVEEALLEAELNHQVGTHLFKITAALVHAAEESKSGCTLVIDLNPEPVVISGQKLAEPLDLKQPHLLELAKSLSKVDGALHIGQDLRLHGFCVSALTGGQYLERIGPGGRVSIQPCGSRPSDGTFLSSWCRVDRPVATIQEGVEISAQCQWIPLTSCRFPSVNSRRLDRW